VCNNEQKAQYKRRVREFNTQLAECKQERAMESFDHKNAVAKLTKEKAALSGTNAYIKLLFIYCCFCG